MLPTPVFTLVIAEILRHRFGVPSYVFGALLCANTLVPGFALRLPAAEFETPRVPEVEVAQVDAVEKDDVVRQARQ